jgi:hypothetical protein
MIGIPWILISTAAGRRRNGMPSRDGVHVHQPIMIGLTSMIG